MILKIIGLISFVEGISIWFGYHRSCIVLSGVYCMKNTFLCKVLLKFIVLEECCLIVVDQFQ